MRALPRLGWVAVCVACALPMTAATAQISLDAPGILPTKPKPGPPPVRAKPPPWPRLDPGAVLCRTPEDLARLAANRTGGPGGGAADCRIISSPTPIEIVHRAGPGRTEVNVTGTGATGWTDTWLPATPPNSSR